MFDFSETRLDLGMPLGKGGPSYRTIVTRNTRDFEKRHMKQPEWLFSGDVGQVLLFAKQIEYLTAFFNARRGKAQGFRYKWWADYKVTATPLVLADGATTQGVTFPLTGTGGISLFYTRKRYTWGGQTTYKTVTKLRFGTTKVFINGVEQLSGFIFNFAEGAIGFASPPAAGAVITWEGEFDLPVRFDIDYLPGALLAIDSYGNTIFDKGTGEPYYQFSSIPIVELVQPVLGALTAPLDQIDKEIDLGIRLANGGYEYRTEIIKTESAYEAAFHRRRAPLYKGDFGSFVAVDLEVDYLLCVFNVLRGRATGFLYKNLQDHRATHAYAPLPPLGGSQGIVVGFVGDGVKTQFQLAKQYENNADVLIKPVFSAVSPISVKVDGVTTAVTLFANGTIQFASAPANGAVISWEGEFRLPVRLDADKITLTAVYLDAQPTLLSTNSFDSCDQMAFKIDGLDLVEYPVGLFSPGASVPEYDPCTGLAKWTCVDGVCISAIGGIYDTLAECEANLDTFTDTFTHAMNSGMIDRSYPNAIVTDISTSGTYMSNATLITQCSYPADYATSLGTGVGSNQFQSDYDAGFYGDNSGSCTYTVTYKKCPTS